MELYSSYVLCWGKGVVTNHPNYCCIYKNHPKIPSKWWLVLAWMDFLIVLFWLRWPWESWILAPETLLWIFFSPFYTMWPLGLPMFKMGKTVLVCQKWMLTLWHLQKGLDTENCRASMVVDTVNPSTQKTEQVDLSCFRPGRAIVRPCLKKKR